jgi:NADPH-dependent glutamate synthase beta subunit-like oxidoreductase
MRAAGNIYIGGDLAGRGTIVEAVGDGKKAAEAILERIRSRRPAPGEGGGS